MPADDAHPATGEEESRLLEILSVARSRGFLGPGEPIAHLRHAEGLAGVAEELLGYGGPEEFCDLGSGGGVPGLVLAVRWRSSEVVLIDAGRRRCDALREAVGFLGLAGRVEVVEGRAELIAHEDRWRERFPLVVARSFAQPAVTAEIAAGLVEVGGLLLVSEPPAGEGMTRWPEEKLATLGFGEAEIRRVEGLSAAAVHKISGADPRWPRRVGIPAKRPLW